MSNNRFSLFCILNTFCTIFCVVYYNFNVNFTCFHRKLSTGDMLVLGSNPHLYSLVFTESKYIDRHSIITCTYNNFIFVSLKACDFRLSSSVSLRRIQFTSK